MMENKGELCPREDSLLLVLDVQERVLPHVFRKETVVNNCQKLIQVARILAIPTLLTEHYPQGLGTTVKEVKELLPDIVPIEKVSFSCCGHPPFIERLAAVGKKAIIVCGVEAHVCVMQTALDLLGRNYLPFVVQDAISSRTEENWKAAVARLTQAGAMLVTTEMITFELLRKAPSEEFRQVLPLFR